MPHKYLLFQFHSFFFFLTRLRLKLFYKSDLAKNYNNINIDYKYTSKQKNTIKDHNSNK